MADLTPSLEDYLESILIISFKEKVVRVRDIAKLLDVKSSSVIGALKILGDKGLVVHEKYGYIELTKQGVVAAEEVYKKHKILLKFFHKILDIDLETSLRDACVFEHSINEKTLERIKKLVEFLENSPGGISGWFSKFQHFLEC